MSPTTVVAASASKRAPLNLRTALLALLALGALVLSVLAMHSAAPGFGTAMVAMTMTTTATLILAASHDGMVDCALMVMGCVMLLVLAALVLSRPPALRQGVRTVLPRVISHVFAVASPIHRPRLTVLCINRV